jgi:hypothetical protein
LRRSVFNSFSSMSLLQLLVQADGPQPNVAIGTLSRTPIPVHQWTYVSRSAPRSQRARSPTLESHREQESGSSNLPVSTKLASQASATANAAPHPPATHNFPCSIGGRSAPRFRLLPHANAAILPLPRSAVTNLEPCPAHSSGPEPFRLHSFQFFSQEPVQAIPLAPGALSLRATCPRSPGAYRELASCNVSQRLR